MSFVSNFRTRSRARRNQRALERAIVDAPSRSVRDELIIAAQRSGISPRF